MNIEYEFTVGAHPDFPIQLPQSSNVVMMFQNAQNFKELQ
jgi:hypothetical protein